MLLCLQALGLQEALMDRVLMRVMILKEDVEYSRCVLHVYERCKTAR